MGHGEETLPCAGGETLVSVLREAVDPLSLAVVRARLDGSFNNLV